MTLRDWVAEAGGLSPRVSNMWRTRCFRAPDQKGDGKHPFSRMGTGYVSSIPNDFLMDQELISIFREFNDRITPTPIRVDMR